MSAASDFRRAMGMDMIQAAGERYDMAESASRTVTSGTFIIQPGDTMFDYTNVFSCPMRIIVKDNQVQAYELLWSEL